MQTQQFWTKVYQKNIGKMIGVCYRYVGNRQVAEDLAHEAFLTAIEESSKYRQLGSFEGWLMRINLNTTLMYLRKRPNFIPADEADLADKIPVYEETMEGKSRDFTQAEIMDAIAALPDRHRAVFNLFVFEKQKHAQIAETLNIGERSSKRYLAEARQQLQHILSQFQKNRKTYIMIILSLIIKKSYAIDTVCKAKLSGLSLAPLSASPLASINWAAVPKPNGWVTLSAAQVPEIVGVTTCVVGALTTAIVATHPVSKSNATHPITEKTVTVDTFPSENMEIVADNDMLEGEKIINAAIKTDSNSNGENSHHVQVNTKDQDFTSTAEPAQGQGYESWKLFQKHGFYGLCDDKGKVMVYPKYTRIDAYDVYKKGWVLVEQFGFLGFVDSLGKEIVTPQYDEIGKFGQYRNGLALVSKGGFYGFINESGANIVPVEYDKTDLIN